MSKYYLYISQWEEHDGCKGIGLLDFDDKTETLDFRKTMESEYSWSATALDQEKGILYINNEEDRNPDYTKGGGGFVHAFKIDPKTGDLTRINQAASCCPNPTYLSLDHDKKYLVCANHSAQNAVTQAARGEDGKIRPVVLYDGALVDLFEINADGSIGELLDVAEHTRLLPGYQLHSHPQCCNFSPSGKLIAVCDQGDEHVYIYTIDREAGRLKLVFDYNDEKGGGARQCAFHPTLPYLYVVHQRERNVLVFRYDEDGKLEKLAVVDSLPADYDPDKQVSDTRYPSKQEAVVIHPDGKTLYSILRWPSVVTAFAIDQTTGIPAIKQMVELEDGSWARHAALTPDGRYLIVACRVSGDVVVYRVAADGGLTEVKRANVPGGAFVTPYIVEA